jgi:chromosome partitioning protein
VARAAAGRYHSQTVTRIIAVANQKGGVGKTTTAVNLSACLAESGIATLLIDLDPQCNATSGLGLKAESPRRSIYGVLGGQSGVAEATVPTAIPNLSLLPACADLAGAMVELADAENKEFVLQYALHGHLEQYDFVFIDCPPSLGVLTVNALTAAGEVLVPVQAEYFALEGLAGLLETVDLVRERVNPDLRLLGVLVTMLDGRTRLGREVAAEVKAHFADQAFTTVVPRNVRLGEAPSYGQPISRYDATCAGSDAYFDLAEEIVSRA